MSVENRMKVLLGEAALGTTDLAKTIDTMKQYIALVEEFAKFQGQLSKQSEAAFTALDNAVDAIGKGILVNPGFSERLLPKWEQLEDLHGAMSETVRALEAIPGIETLEDARGKMLEILYDVPWVDTDLARNVVSAYEAFYKARNQVENAVEDMKNAAMGREWHRRFAEVKKSLKALEDLK